MIDPAEELECAQISALYTGSTPPPDTPDAIVARNSDLFSLAGHRPVPKPPQRRIMIERELAQSAPVRIATPEDGVLNA